MSDDRITQEEMASLFGKSMPIEAVAVLMADDRRPMEAIRSDLAAIKAKQESAFGKMLDASQDAGWQRVLALEEFLIDTREKLIDISRHVRTPEGKSYDCANAFEQLAMRFHEVLQERR